MRRRVSKQKPRRKVGQKNKSRHIPKRANSQASNRKYGLGSEIASLFRGIGLKPGEEIQELHDLTLKTVDFSDH